MRIGTRDIAVPKYFRDNYFVDKRARLFFDAEKMLFGIQPSVVGYKFKDEVIGCKIVPSDVPRGKFSASWDPEQNMIIADLSDPI